MFKAWASGAAGMFLALISALPVRAAAEAAGPPQSLRDALFPPEHSEPGRGPPTGAPAAAPPVARYRLDAGESFVIDRLDRDEALLKFDGGDEVWALKGVAAGHGDMVFKNDVGEPVLRIRWGGLTLFTPSAPAGLPAALEGGALALRPGSPIGPQALLAILAQSSARAGRMVGHTVAFDAAVGKAEFDWLFADAAQLASDAFVRAAQDGRRALAARFSQVRLVSGRAPAVATSGTMVMITVAPDHGIAGRPSSLRVLAVMERR